MWSIIAPVITTVEMREGTAYAYEKDAYHVILKPARPDGKKDREAGMKGEIKRFVFSIQ